MQQLQKEVLNYRIVFKDLMEANIDENYYNEVIRAMQLGKFDYPLTRLSGSRIRKIEEIKEIIDLKKQREEKELAEKKQAERFGIYENKKEVDPFISLCKRVLKWQLKCWGLIDVAIQKANPEMKKEIKEYLETSIRDLFSLPENKRHNSGTLPDTRIISNYKEFLKII